MNRSKLKRFALISGIISSLWISLAFLFPFITDQNAFGEIVRIGQITADSSFTYQSSVLKRQQERESPIISVNLALNPEKQEKWQPELNILSDSGQFDLSELFDWVKQLEGMEELLKDLAVTKGTLYIDELFLTGPLMEPGGWNFRVEGKVEGMEMASVHLPESISMTGWITAGPEKIEFTDCELSFMDSTLLISGRIENYLKGPREADLRLEGKMGPQAVRWIGEFMETPARLKVNQSLEMKNAQVLWSEGEEARFSGKLLLEEGPKIITDIRYTEKILSVKQLRIVDKNSDLVLSFRLQDKELDMTFEGHLKGATLDRILEENPYLEGEIEGDFQGKILLNNLPRSTVYGMLKIENGFYPDYPFQLANVVLHAEGDRLVVESSSFFWADKQQGSLSGAIDFSADAFYLDLDLAADGLKWEDWKKFRALRHGKEKRQKKVTFDDDPFKFDIAFGGIIRTSLEYFKYGRYRWKPVKGQIKFFDKERTIQIDEANLCGIQTSGHIHFTPEAIRRAFHGSASNQSLRDTLECLWGREDLITGSYDLKADITFQEEKKGDDPIESLRGTVEFNAENGRIYRFGLLARIFSVVNITEILRWRTPDLMGEGLAFNTLVAQGVLEGETLVLEEVILDGPSINIFTIGSLNFRENTLDLTVTLAPFRMVDFIIDRIPLLGHILGGNLISLPVRVSGSMDNPVVSPLSPQAVGDRLIGIMKRTLTLPFRLIDPILPQEEEDTY